MADIQDEIKQLKEQVEQIKNEYRDFSQIKELLTPNNIYFLSVLWADFHMLWSNTSLKHRDQPELIKPDINKKVYTIFDYGDMLSTSRSEDMFSGIRSTGKYFATIDKMVHILEQRMQVPEPSSDDSTGGSGQIEFQVAFAGHELGRRKAFESMARLTKNIVITNYDPENWANKRLKTIQQMVDLGYGLPKPTL